jgi:hypothetical protein
MLRPIARLCLRSSVGVQFLIECLKEVLLELSSEEIEQNGEKVTTSRLSVMTGLHRRDVARLRAKGRAERATFQPGIISRVIGRWTQERGFLTVEGKPRLLTVEGEDSEFSRLVFESTRDVHASTILRELERVGAVERTNQKGDAQRVRLLQNAYVPGRSEEGFAILARDIEDLILAVEENVDRQESIPNLHGRTEYDNIALSKLPEIRAWLFKEGTAFHVKIRSYLAQFDKDLNSSIDADGGGRVVVGNFSRIEGGKHDS